MALWGTADGIYSPGTVAVDYATETITGTGTSFGSAGISTGTVIVIGVGGTFGQAVVSGVTSERVISIATTQYLSGLAISGVGYTFTQKPIYTLEDTNYDLTPTDSTGLSNTIFGVDTYEQDAVNASGSQYHSAHAGWVGVHTYVDMHGNYRVKSETLVAFSGITTGTPSYTSIGDAADDITYYPDVYITIATQPASIGVGTTATATFTVAASATPTASLTYQWQYASSVGAGFTNLSNGATYSGTTTTGLGVTNTNATLNGYNYRVVISSTTGGATATSNAAVMTVS